MSAQAVATRYSKALFGLAKENGTAEKVLADLRALAEVFSDNKDLMSWAKSPLIAVEKKLQTVKTVVSPLKMSAEVKNLAYLLAERGRIEILPQVEQAYTREMDQDNGVIRGVVRSAAVLTPEERAKIEDMVTKVTKKKVILNYKLDSTIIGGLVAQVGSYTFDDSLESHLKRLNEELKRRAH